MISIGLIHSNIEARTVSARQQLAGLCDETGATCFEVSAQGNLVEFMEYKPLGFSRIRRKLVRKIYGSRRRQHQSIKSRSSEIFKAWIFVGERMFRTVFRGPETRLSMKRTGLIERYLLLKHLSCHQRFLESKAKVLLVLEDDAKFSGDPSELSFELAKSLQEDHRAAFLELTSSFPAEVLGVTYLPDAHKPGWFTCNPGSSNTTAAYACNRKFSESFLAFMASNPLAFCLPVDAALDYFFHETKNSSLDIICFHRAEPLFMHGSLLGLQESTIR